VREKQGVRERESDRGGRGGSRERERGEPGERSRERWRETRRQGQGSDKTAEEQTA